MFLYRDTLFVVVVTLDISKLMVEDYGFTDDSVSF